MIYSNSSIDRVRDADIVKTISHYCTLKKSGADYKCNSPFTAEKTPSFVVSPAKEIFKCFSSGNGGDGIKFVMLKEGCEFIEAVEKVASIHNIYLEKEEVTADQKIKLDQKAEMYHILDLVSRGFSDNYKKLDVDHWAKKMISERGYNDETLINYQVGFSSENNALTKWAIEKGVLGVAKELGLSDAKSSQSYDKFKDRLIFPIHDHKGAVVGFGGRRSNSETASKYPKYLNSKESIVYNKSKVLYGLYQAKSVIRKTGTAIMTEGYTDVLGMAQHGVENTVASCGTALTKEHGQLLKKFAQEVIILRDGDKAGSKAIIRDIDILLSFGFQVSLCILPEGEDPDSFAKIQKENLPAWINKNKQDALIWKVNQYDLTRNNYQSDIDNINEICQLSVNSILENIVSEEELQDLKGDDLKAAKEANTNYLNEIKHLQKEAKNDVKDVPEIDPTKKTEAFNDICNTLYNIKHEVKRTEYIRQLSKILNVTVASVKAEIGKLEVEATTQKEKSIGAPSTRNLRLPAGADKEEYFEHGFVTVDNCYHFQRSNGSFFQGTQFKFQPLFHIQGDKENKRLSEITNVLGKKKLIDFDSDMLANFSEFRKYLFRIGGFMFLTHNGVKTEHFDKFVYRFEDQFQPALELLTLGWNKQGFYAFADGVFWEGKFRAVNKYGIMHLEGVDTNSNEYTQKIDYRYSPAFSVMHQNNQDGDDKFENDRFFVYKQSPIELSDWMGQMQKVFQEKGIIGILFNFGALFRDIFLSHYDSFPLLGGFGEKDSGKSGFGKILQNFFYYRLPALDLTQATHVGFSRRLSRNHNTIQFLDEYQDKQCDDKIFSGMMGAWNGIGREKGMNSQDKRTQYDKINSAIYYAGQFMPTRMENALATRTISLLFQTKNFTSEEKEAFNKLLNWTNQGISSLVVELVQHRGYFEKRLPSVHSETVRTLKELLKDQDYQERIFGNVAMLLTTFHILKDKIDFPFEAKEVEALLSKTIIDNSEQIADSNGLTEFWSIVQFLFETNQVKDEYDFKIEPKIEFKILEKNKQYVSYKNSERKKILFIRLNSVFQFYNKEVTKREGVDVIGQTTLRQYFKSRPYYIGAVKGVRFGKAGSQSCYAFDYDAMQNLNLVTLHEDLSVIPPEDKSEASAEASDQVTPRSPDDDLPF